MNFKEQLLIYYYNWYYSFTEYMLLMLEFTSSFFIKHVSYILTIIILTEVASLAYIEIFLTSRHHDVHVEITHIIFTEIWFWCFHDKAIDLFQSSCSTSSKK